MKTKLKRYSVIGVILAAIFFVGGILLYNQSGKLRVVSLGYDESASLKYKVYLNNNSYYNKEYLDEGMQYISGIINTVEITYDYNIKYSDKVNSTLINDVNANVKIVDVTNNEKVIYEKNESLKSDKKDKTNVDTLSSSESITIDYQKYNNFANEFKSKYGISADCKLIITFTTSQKNSNDLIANFNRSKSMVVEIPLSEQMITIGKTPDAHEKSNYFTTSAKTFSNQMMFIAALVAFGLSILLVVLSIYFYIKRRNLTSLFDREIEKILKQYDAYITESTGSVSLKADVIYVRNFKELLDVRNNIEKAIIYNKVNDNEARFIILDDAQEYCYKVKREDYM